MSPKSGLVKNMINVFDRRNSDKEINKKQTVETIVRQNDSPNDTISKVFKIFDKNGDGHFNKKQLMEIMHSFGLHVRSNEMNLLLEGVRMDADGNINLNEFVNLFTDIENDKTEFENDLRETFSIFDKKNTGYISVSDLGLILNNFGLNLSDNEVKEMIAEADADHDELISFYDLMMLLCNDDNNNNEDYADENDNYDIERRI